MMAKSIPLLTLVALLAGFASHALADGGVVRAIEQHGGLQISVFTSPAVLAAGDVDLSVLVQDVETMTELPAAAVAVQITPRERPYAAQRLAATRELATNKLLHACHVPLEPGWHDVRVEVEAESHRGAIEFAMQVGPQPTKAASFWPWFAWPAVPIVLVAAHLWRVRRGRV
jgi:hypothetical protein